MVNYVTITRTVIYKLILYFADVLDNKDIKATTRDFIKRFEHEKSLNKLANTKIIHPSK